MHFKMYIMFLNYAFKIVSFSCISGKTEENDERVIEVKMKMIKLESMPNEFFFKDVIFSKYLIVNIFSRA